VASSVLLALAVKILIPEHGVAILRLSPSLAIEERIGALRRACAWTAPDRCFHCKACQFTGLPAD